MKFEVVYYNGVGVRRDIDIEMHNLIKFLQKSSHGYFYVVSENTGHLRIAKGVLLIQNLYVGDTFFNGTRNGIETWYFAASKR